MGKKAKAYIARAYKLSLLSFRFRIVANTQTGYIIGTYTLL